MRFRWWSDLSEGRLIEGGKAEVPPHTGVVCGGTDYAANRSIRRPAVGQFSIAGASKPHPVLGIT